MKVRTAGGLTAQTCASVPWAWLAFARSAVRNAERASGKLAGGGMGRQPNIRPSLHSWPVLGASSAGPSGNNFAYNCEMMIHTSKVAPIPVFQVNISLFLTARSMAEDCCALMLSRATYVVDDLLAATLQRLG
jgi:hypothetical protein